MSKQKHRRKRSRKNIKLVLAFGAGIIITSILLFKIFANNTSQKVIQLETTQMNVLSTQKETTSTVETTMQTNMDRKVQQSTNQMSETIESSSTAVEKNANESLQKKESGQSLKKETAQVYRLGELGNSGLEFATLDEAYNYGADILKDKKAFAELQSKHYNGYSVHPVRWSDNSITFTIQWQ